jgi:hypothetical protein
MLPGRKRSASFADESSRLDCATSVSRYRVASFGQVSKVWRPDWDSGNLGHFTNILVNNIERDK